MQDPDELTPVDTFPEQVREVFGERFLFGNFTGGHDTEGGIGLRTGTRERSRENRAGLRPRTEPDPTSLRPW